MDARSLARIAALIGEPARSAMLLALMDGRALTANELARVAGIGAPTASRHLAQLVEAGLLVLQVQGRHRYHRLAGGEIARALEALLQVSAAAPAARSGLRTGPADDSLRLARRCYDHLAGRLGVAIAQHLQDEGGLLFDGDAAQVLPRLPALLAPWGLPDDALAPGTRRVVCRPCLDWSERRPHAAGRLGALLCSHCVEQGWLRVPAGSRVVQLTPRGAVALRDWLGLQAWRRVVEPEPANS